jgi:hypothetical protein
MHCLTMHESSNRIQKQYAIDTIHAYIRIRNAHIMMVVTMIIMIVIM